MMERREIGRRQAEAANDARAAIDPQDALYAGLRVAALVGASAWVFFGLAPGATRDALLVAFGVFVPYCGVLYLAGAGLLRTQSKSTFYVVAALSDLVFIVVLLYVSGERSSPFAPALPLWTALYATRFGLRGGLATGATMLGVRASFDLRAHVVADAWQVASQVASAALHGPVVGYLFDCAAGRGHAMRAAHDEIATAHRRLVDEQAALIDEEKHRSVAVVAAGIAHEINNPLSGIMQCARALSDGTVPDDRKAEYYGSILEAVGRVSGVIAGLRDYSRRQSAVPVDLDAAELVSSCLHSITPLCEEAGVRVEASLTKGEVRIRAEASQLRKALTNVVMNAIYFSARGDKISIQASKRGHMWGVAVEDHGPGISKENLSKVMVPFFTTKPHGDGTGLGLAITYGVLRSFGGELEITSKEGSGTTVTLWLPAAGGRSHA